MLDDTLASLPGAKALGVPEPVQAQKVPADLDATLVANLLA